MDDRNRAPGRDATIPANDNGSEGTRRELDRVAFSIARLIGRRMAREYFAALVAANDNRPQSAKPRAEKDQTDGDRP